MMNAAECLKSSDAKAVAEYYAELRRHGDAGECAFHLLRAHKNITRMVNYDDEKYLRFLAGRRDFALKELLGFIGSPRELEDCERIVVPIQGKTEVCFTRTRTGNWHSSKKNEAAILRYCDRIASETEAA